MAIKIRNYTIRHNDLVVDVDGSDTEAGIVLEASGTLDLEDIPDLSSLYATVEALAALEDTVSDLEVSSGGLPLTGGTMTGAIILVDGNPAASEEYVDTAVAGKANTSHTQAISTITGLQAALNAKADDTDLTSFYTTTTDLNSLLSTQASNDRARANHTGSQLATTISDFSTAVDARITSGAIASALSYTPANAASLNPANLSTVVPIAKGGTGLSTIASGKMLYASALDTIAPLTLGAAFSITSGTLNLTSGGLTLFAEAGNDLIPNTTNFSSLGNTTHSIKRIFAADGSESAPANTFANDPGTGTYSYASGYWGVTANSTLSMLVSAGSISLITSGGFDVRMTNHSIHTYDNSTPFSIHGGRDGAGGYIRLATASASCAFSAASAAPADADVMTGFFCFYRDDATHTLKVKVKRADNTVETGTVAALS